MKLLSLFLLLCSSSLSFAFVVTPLSIESTGQVSRELIATQLGFSAASAPVCTELPDSLQDAAVRAAEATVEFNKATFNNRCRIDFDTSVGDETFTLLKTSTEFMQQYVSALCYAMIPGLQQLKQDEMMRVIQAKADLQAIEDDTELSEKERQAKEEELLDIINRNGQDKDAKWEGPIARIYFPDEGNAAYARQEWLGLRGKGAAAKVPPCCQFSSCGGVPVSDVSKDAIVFFFCPKASESESVEEILERTETSGTTLQMSILVNPNLVDMGVTGFGMAGRRLRERLLDKLENVYYLRTLPWGALTRQWPNLYSVWQEDENAVGGYRLIKELDTLPSNPDVEDIYDIENGNMSEREGGGFLDQFGDFVNGMMRL